MTAGARILLVDDDPWIQRMVSTILAKRGHRVDTASDGVEGLARANDAPPDLIITDVMMPRMDGWAFVRAVRSRPELALTPVIFLTALAAENDRMRGFALGADDYLPKPFRFEELEARVATALGKRAQMQGVQQQMRDAAGASEPPITEPGTDPSQPPVVVMDPAAPSAPIPSQEDLSRPVLHGALDQIGLSSLLVMLEMERKSGILILQQRGELGRVSLRKGRVVRAEVEGGEATRRGPEAVYHLLAWSDGRFDFNRMEVDGEDEVRLSTTGLLMEGARLIDEMNKDGA